MSNEITLLSFACISYQKSFYSISPGSFDDQYFFQFYLDPGVEREMASVVRARIHVDDAGWGIVASGGGSWLNRSVMVATGQSQ